MKDFMIVGFGLAGMTLAHELEERGQSFVVFDQGDKNASKVAGGLTNPLILKRFTKAWKADEFIPVADRTYQAMEEKLSIKALKPMSVYRKIKSAREQNDWFVASDKRNVGPFMDGELKELKAAPNPFKYGKVLGSSFMDTERLLNAYAAYLMERKAFQKESFRYDNLQIKDETVHYKDWKAKQLIFCEGIGMLQNPYFKELPLIGNKGEYLLVNIPELHLKSILKSTYALIPLGGTLYKFGATYSRDFEDDRAEEASRLLLKKKLEELISHPFEIIEQEVGVRPTVLDRRPLLGNHPKYKELWVCNGFGSHGVMMAPTMAKWLLDDILDGKKLPKKVNLKRYFKIEG